MRLAWGVLLLATVALAQEQTTSVAEAARQARAPKEKTAKTVGTNDDLSTTDVPSNRKANVDPERSQARIARDAIDKQKTIDAQWASVLNQQKARIAELELRYQAAKDTAERSVRRYPVGANPRYEQNTAYAESLKKQLDLEKKRLEELQDQAHKAGANKAYD